MQLDLALIQFCKAQNTKERLVWSCCETYDSIDWSESNEISKPSLKDLEKAWKDYEEWKIKADALAEYNQLIPSAEEQLQMIFESGLDGWMDQMMEIKKKHPQYNTLKVAPKMNLKINELQKDLESVNANLANTNLNTNEVKQLMKDIEAGLSAIKGFLVYIPEIHKYVKKDDANISTDSETK